MTFLCFMFFFFPENVLYAGALQSQNGKNQVKNEDLLELLYGCM
jgi:hypothetical protein